MAHLAALKPPSISSTVPSKTTTALLPRSRLSEVKAVTNGNTDHQDRNVPRRNITFIGLAVLGLSSVGSGSAMAASRRPPPPPPEEKKDPNVTGLAAKVLASKKRKEAMKETIAKLKERGKKIVDEPSESQ